MNMKNHYKIRNLYIIIAILIIYFEPQLFKEGCYEILPKIDYIYKMLKVIGFIIITIIYVRSYVNKEGKIRISKLLLAMSTYQIICLVSTILNSGDILRFIGPSITTISMIMIAEILIESEMLFITLKKINKYFRLCFVINVISIVLVDYLKILPGQDIYFLGIDNRWVFTYLPWITFEFVVALYEENKNKALKYFLCAEITLIYKWSASAMLCFLLWIIVFIDIKLCKQAVKIYILTVLANVTVIVFKIQNYFNNLLQNVLHKSLTLSGRTFLWDKILNDLVSFKYLGIGMQTIEFDQNYFFTSNDYQLQFLAVSHAHNSYMTVLYRSGICGLISYMIVWVLSLKKLKQNREHPLSNVLFIALVIVMLLSIFDTIDCSGLYFIMGCAYSITKIKMKRSE